MGLWIKMLTAGLVLLAICAAASAAWLFDGTDTVTMADSDTLTLPTGDWSLSGWIKMSATSTSLREVFEWGTTGGYPWIRLFINGSGMFPYNDLYVQYKSTSSTAKFVVGGSVGDSTVWNHVAIVRSGNTLTMYYNGSSVGTPANMTYEYAINPSVAWYWGDGTAFNGALAEWAGWTDHALTAEELAALVAAGAPEDCATAPEWHLDMFDAVDCQIGSLSLTDNGVTIDYGTHPVDRGDPFPLPVTMVWPKDAEDYNDVSHDTYIVWTKTPVGTALDQRFTVYMDTVNPPVVREANEITALYVDVNDLTDGTTYYVRVDANSVGGITQGEVVEFKARSYPTTGVYYVAPLRAGDGTGDCEPNAMAWEYIDANTVATDTIRLVDPNVVMYYNYEGSYTAWPDRIYEANEVQQHEITWTLQDYRRIFRFVTGDYGVVGPAILMYYDPALFIDGAYTRNGMMVNPANNKHGLDSRAEATNYDASLNLGDNLPYVVSTYPSSVLNVIAIDATDPLYNDKFYHEVDGAILTVVETGLANNVWFRPSYHSYTGRAVEYQWSDIITDRLPQVDLNCTKTLLAASNNEARNTTTNAFPSIERIVSRPTFELLSYWGNEYLVPRNNAAAYGGTFGMEMSVAYLACFDSDLGTIEDKKTLVAGCIQRGLDFGGLYRDGESAWWSADGGHRMGRYWPILFAGIMLDDETLRDIGIDTHQDIDDSWTETPRMDFQENQQTFQLTTNFLGAGSPFWATPPWKINGISGIADSTGTVAVTKGSTTVTGQAGDDWSSIVTVDDDGNSDNDERDWFITATYDAETETWTILDEGQDDVTTATPYIIVAKDVVANPPTITLDREYTGETNAAATFIIADELYVGNQYGVSKDADYSEFTSAWSGKYWWVQRPADTWSSTGSTYAEDPYQSIVTSSVKGLGLCAVIMKKYDGYDAVTQWNSPQFFGYVDRINTDGDSGTYCDAWVASTLTAEWEWTAPATGPVRPYRGRDDLRDHTDGFRSRWRR